MPANLHPRSPDRSTGRNGCARGNLVAVANARFSQTAVLRGPTARPLPVSLGTAAVWGTVLAASAFLLARIAPDVRGKPLFEDEAVAGLVAIRPLAEVFETVMWERGGGPLHFVLSHLALEVSPSAYALRWLSVVFALATIPLLYDLGRRLAGPLAGGAAAVVGATSSLLAVYGSFGRMYSLYAFATALAITLFVRAVEQRTARAALVAALAAWLLPAIHPYGAILVAAEAIVALVLWRGRPLRPALPVFAVGVALLPFAWADLRLADRFGVGLDGEEQLAAPEDAWGQMVRALTASAGGEGWTSWLALGLVVFGAAVLARRRPAFVALAAVALLVPPLLLVVVRSGIEPGLSPRHLIFALPLAAGLIGAAVARLFRDISVPLRVVLAGFLVAAAVLAPTGGIQDPRDWWNDVLGGGPPAVALGSEERLAAPVTWLRAHVEEDDVLYPYSPVYLGALDAASRAQTLPYSQASLIERALERVPSPAPGLVVSVPLGSATVDVQALRARLGDRFEPHFLGSWLLLESTGPLADDHTVLRSIYYGLRSTRLSVRGERRFELDWYFNVTLAALCTSVRAYGDRCPPSPP
jgi:Dolichyl-phosphate-mannose-protein mannosyltransferase